MLFINYKNYYFLINSEEYIFITFIFHFMSFTNVFNKKNIIFHIKSNCFKSISLF